MILFCFSNHSILKLKLKPRSKKHSVSDMKTAKPTTTLASSHSNSFVKQSTVKRGFILGAILLLLILILHFGNPTMFPKIELANVGFVKPMNKSLHVRLQEEVKEAVAQSKRLRDALVEATTAASAQALTLEQMKGIHTEESKNFLLEKKVLVKRLAEKMEKDTEEHLEKKMVEDHTKVPSPVPLSIDVGGVEFAGRKDNFIVTNIYHHNFNILDLSSMKQFINGRPVGRYMTEHVFEHLSYNDAKTGLQNMYATLIDGGRVRICVPDGYLPSVKYQEYIKVGNAFKHKMVWTIDNLKPLLEKVGFEVVPLEYWNKDGTERYTGQWDDKDGYLQRTSKERTDTYDNILHTSLSLDAFKTTTKSKALQHIQKKDGIKIENNMAEHDSCKDEPKNLAVMMTAEEQQLLESYMTPTTRYFEWGSGGSTDTYSRLTSNTVVSIENYKGWCDKVSSLPYVKCREREGNLFYKCIVPYPTIQYGYPEDPANNGKFDEYINAIEEYQNFDVVLVDARWRVACALKALDYITDDTVVFMHDMGPLRTYYDSVFKWYKEIKRADSLVAMRRRKNVLRPTEEEFKKYKYKPKW